MCSLKGGFDSYLDMEWIVMQNQETVIEGVLVEENKMLVQMRLGKEAFRSSMPIVITGDSKFKAMQPHGATPYNVSVIKGNQ